MSNSTKNIIAQIMANSPEENMAKFILDIKKKRKEIGISNNDLRSENPAKIDGILTQSEMYKKIRSALKNKKPTFYFIEKVGDKSVIFLKKGDKEMKRYEFEGDFTVPVAAAAVATATTNDLQTKIQNIIDICALLYELVETTVIQIPAVAPALAPAPVVPRVNYTGREFMNNYSSHLVDFIVNCNENDLNAFLDREFGNHTREDLFYQSLKANETTNDILEILEPLVVTAHTENCAPQAGGARKKRGGSRLKGNDLKQKMKTEMKKGKSSVKTVSGNAVIKVMNLVKKAKPTGTVFQLNTLTPLPNTLKNYGSRYEAFKRYLDEYITRINAEYTTSIANHPVGANQVRYIDFDFISEEVSKNIQNQISVSLRPNLTTGRAGINANLLLFIEKSKKTNSGKSSNAELKQFIQKYKKDLETFLKNTSRTIRNPLLFLPIMFDTERDMRATGLASLNSTEYRLYQFYNVFFNIFNNLLSARRITYPFQLPLDSEAMQRVIRFILLKLHVAGGAGGAGVGGFAVANMGSAGIGALASGIASPNDITNGVFTDELATQYLHRYYREKNEREVKSMTKREFTVIEIEKNQDSFYNAIFSSLYCQNYNLNEFLEWIGGNPENFVAAGPGGNTGFGVAIGVDNPDSPIAASRDGLINFSNQINVDNAMKLNGEATITAGGGTPATPASIRWQIAYGGTNKTFNQVFEFLDTGVNTCKTSCEAVSQNAENAFIEYRRWFVGQLRKMIGTRVSTTTIFDSFIKKLIQDIHANIEKNNSKSLQNTSKIFTSSKNVSLTKYKGTFFEKIFKKISDIPSNDQLNLTGPNFANIKREITNSILGGAKACELEMLVLNTLIQSNISNLGFIDISHLQSSAISNKGSVDSYILMANGVFKQIEKIKISESFNECILIKSDESNNFNAVIKGYIAGATQERCEMMRGLAHETIISYDNLVVARAAFESLKGDGTVIAHGDLNTFYQHMITNPVANYAAAIGAVSEVMQKIAIPIARKKRGEIKLREEYVYDPCADTGFINEARTGIITDVNSRTGSPTSKDGLNAVIPVDKISTPLVRFNIN
jgi:hypothetical protein